MGSACRSCHGFFAIELKFFGIVFTQPLEYLALILTVIACVYICGIVANYLQARLMLSVSMNAIEALRNDLSKVNIAGMSDELGVGGLTLKDIIDELSKPGRDPREDLPKPILRSDVLKFEDLRENEILTGTVRNVTDFGAFVDIGVKHDGLVHISELSDKYVKNPRDVVSVGDIVKVKVIGIDLEKQKVALSMKGIE